MSSKPILFNTEMVKAILDGRKTQVRIPIKLNCKKDNETHSLNGAVFTIDNKLYFEHNLIENFSKYKTGDVCYVRETFKLYHGFVFYKTDDYSHRGIQQDHQCMGWESSSYMPKKYARIFLKVTNVRVEKLHDISHDDIYNEGFPSDFYKKSGQNFRNWFVDLWNSTAKDGYKWEDNPYVFVYEFERIEKQ